MGAQVNQSEEAPSAEVLDRGKREREFFNRYADEEKIPDRLLLVPPDLEVPPEIGDLLPQLAGKVVCDYGCGYGVHSAFFALHGAKTFAFDIAETNVRLAARAARVNGVEDRVILQVMQGEYLGFPEGFFDLVFGNGILHHMDVARAAREVHRVLKPGGVAVFNEPLGENRLLEWARHCRLRSSVHRHSPDERSFHYSDIATLRAVFDFLTCRETRLLTALKPLFQKDEGGMIARPRWRKAFQALSYLDGWLLEQIRFLRPLASFVVISLYKDQCKKR